MKNTNRFAQLESLSDVVSHDHGGLPARTDVKAEDASADPDAGTKAPNGKDIWTAEEAADNLNREVNYRGEALNWTQNNYGELDDGVLTFGFWETAEQVINSYYVIDGVATTSDGQSALDGKFVSLDASQREMAAANVQLWDDLIAIKIEHEENVYEADITFGFAIMSPAAGAHAYLPFGDVYDSYYDQPAGMEVGRLSGDVWANAYYPEDFEGESQNPTEYGWFAITHELGHSLGLSHGGDYNASDDNDGDGQPDPITYANDAYFFQDSHQYTMMSYFAGRNTGARWLDWTAEGGFYVLPATPMVHDILAVQNVYGADYTTRADNTVYGFNSTAGNVVFDFTSVKVPVVTIWDGGGIDTLDLSGYTVGSVIDLNEGAFSSAGHGMSAEAMEYYGLTSAAARDEWLTARNILSPEGRPNDNIAIAYGAVIEKAKGGSGDDAILGNAASNHLYGNAGHDLIAGGDGVDFLVGGAGNDVLNGGAGLDRLHGGAGADTFVFSDNGKDIIRDFKSGVDRIDLSAFDDLGGFAIRNNKVFVDTDGKGGYDLFILAEGVKISDVVFATPEVI